MCNESNKMYYCAGNIVQEVRYSLMLNFNMIIWGGGKPSPKTRTLKKL